jgi:hypothetical protein
MSKIPEVEEPSFLVSLCGQESFYEDLQEVLCLPCSTEEELREKYQQVGMFWLMVWNASWLDHLEHRVYPLEFVEWFRTWDQELKADLDKLHASVRGLR